MKTITIAAIAGLASAAAAQQGTLTIVPSTTTVDTTTSATFTIDVIFDADFGTNIAGGGTQLIASSDVGTTAVVGSVATWAAGFFSDNGADGFGGHDGVIGGQLIFPPLFPPSVDSALGTVYASFQITVAAGSLGTVDYNAAQIAGQPFVFEVFDAGSGTTTALTSADVTFNGATVNFVPAPSAMALLGLGGLVAGRRRR